MARKKRSVTFASNTEGSRANRAFLLQFNALKCVCVCVFLCEAKLLFALGKIRAAKCNVECFDSLTVIAMVTLIFHDTHSQSNVYACGKKMQLRSQRQCAILIRLDSFFSLTPRIFFFSAGTSIFERCHVLCCLRLSVGFGDGNRRKLVVSKSVTRTKNEGSTRNWAVMLWMFGRNGAPRCHRHHCLLYSDAHANFLAMHSHYVEWDYSFSGHFLCFQFGSVSILELSAIRNGVQIATAVLFIQ